MEKRKHWRKGTRQYQFSTFTVGGNGWLNAMEWSFTSPVAHSDINHCSFMSTWFKRLFTSKIRAIAILFVSPNVYEYWRWNSRSTSASQFVLSSTFTIRNLHFFAWVAQKKPSAKTSCVPHPLCMPFFIFLVLPWILSVTLVHCTIELDLTKLKKTLDPIGTDLSLPLQSDARSRTCVDRADLALPFR